jgi:hypothetical protein
MQVNVANGTIIYCDRVRHVVQESIAEVFAALRYAAGGLSHDPDGRGVTSSIQYISEVTGLDGQVIWHMTDGPPGFIRVTPKYEAGYELALAVDKISSIQINWKMTEYRADEEA